MGGKKEHLRNQEHVVKTANAVDKAIHKMTPLHWIVRWRAALLLLGPVAMYAGENFLRLHAREGYTPELFRKCFEEMILKKYGRKVTLQVSYAEDSRDFHASVRLKEVDLVWGDSLTALRKRSEEWIRFLLRPDFQVEHMIRSLSLKPVTADIALWPTAAEKKARENDTRYCSVSGILLPTCSSRNRNGLKLMWDEAM